MTDMIKFHLIPSGERNAAKNVKRSGRIVLLSVLLGLVIVVAVVVIFYKDLKAELGIMQEKKPDIVKKVDKPPQPDSLIEKAKPKSISPYKTISKEDINIKSVSHYLIARRNRWETLLEEIIAGKMRFSSIVSSDDDHVLIHGFTPSDSALYYFKSNLIEKKATEFSKITMQNEKDDQIEYILDAHTYLKPKVPPPLKLIPVKPFNQKTIMTIIDSVGTQNNLKVLDNTVLGTDQEHMLKPFSFIVTYEGKLEMIHKTIKEIMAGSEMMDISSIAIEELTPNKDVKNTKVRASITFSMYNIKDEPKKDTTSNQ